MPDEVELSVLMPCLDEALTLAACIAQARAALEEASVTGEIIVGDNGSTDGSVEIARQHGAEVVPVAVRGYGAAVSGALAAARGRYVLMADSDSSYDFGELPRFVDRLRAGDDLVVGNRFIGRIAPGAMPWKNRHVGNPVLSGLGRALFGVPVRDLHCGIRAFRREAILGLGLRATGMEYASEMVIRAHLAGLRLSEVPATLLPDGRGRPPHLLPWRDGWRHLRFIVGFRVSTLPPFVGAGGARP